MPALRVMGAKDHTASQTGRPLEELRKHYRILVRLWTVVLVLASYALVHYIAPMLGERAAPYAVKMAVSVGVISSIFLAGELFIRKISWKSTPMLRSIGYFGHERLDFDGAWYGETLYEKLEQPGLSATPAMPFSTTHDVEIVQDCLSVEISNTKGTNFPAWGSIAATVDSDGILRFLYDVEYTDRARFPPSSVGYEWMAAYLRAQGGKGRPIMLHGKFGHAVGKHVPTYSGSTLFIRRGHAGSLTLDKLPEAFRSGRLAEQLAAGELK